MLQRKSPSATLQIRAADAVGADVLKRPEYRLSLAAFDASIAHLLYRITRNTGRHVSSFK
jgi:hypothetical protein